MGLTPGVSLCWHPGRRTSGELFPVTCKRLLGSIYAGPPPLLTTPSIAEQSEDAGQG